MFLRPPRPTRTYKLLPYTPLFLSRFTKATLFQPGAATDMLSRFSTEAGEAGSPDAWRDVRGFSMKFYTSEGNYDLVGNNTPVFFVRDPMKFPQIGRAHV